MNCPRCRKDVPQGTAECPHCGVVFSKLREPRAQHQSSRRPTQTPEGAADQSSAPLFSKGFLIALGIIAVLGAGIAWYYFYGPCGTRRVEVSIRNLQQIAERWDDANSVAASAARIALATPVSHLQTIKQDTQQLDVPPCLLPAKKALLSSMETKIESYLAFMRQDDDIVVSSMILGADIDLSTFRSELKVVSACAPFCVSLPE